MNGKGPARTDQAAFGPQWVAYDSRSFLAVYSVSSFSLNICDTCFAFSYISMKPLRRMNTLLGETSVITFYSLLKRVLLYKERSCSRGSKFFPFSVDTLSEGVGNNAKRRSQKLSPLAEMVEKLQSVSSSLKN